MFDPKKIKARNKRLDELLEKAASHVMTPGEIWDQRISFVYGQMMDSNPGISREQIIARATAHYGPRPTI